MVFAQQGVEHSTGVFHAMIKVHDLQAVLERVFAHVFQTVGAIDQYHHFAGAGHAPADGLLAQAGAKVVNGLETGNVGG